MRDRLSDTPCGTCPGSVLLDDLVAEWECGGAPGAPFLKVRPGKGAKFRRVPVSRHLRRELLRYLNRQRPGPPRQAPSSCGRRLS